MTIQTTDLPRTTDEKVILDTDNFAGWELEVREDGSFYACCEAYDMDAPTAEEMTAKLNELGARIVGWE